MAKITDAGGEGGGARRRYSVLSLSLCSFCSEKEEEEVALSDSAVRDGEEERERERPETVRKREI